jgi:threonine dehydrogenase-like Zn-dependent dehydrogenase
MKALTFNYSIPKYLLTGALSRRWPQVIFSSWSLTGVREVPEPGLPGAHWVKIRPKLAGLCGSDMSIIRCRESLTLQPFASFPFIFGHEVCGEIAEVGPAVEGFAPGDRVTVMPALGCATRDIEPLCPMCAAGRNQLCYNFTAGSLAPGMFVGSNADTGGFISEMGVAHDSQLCRVPDGISDENVVLTEPFATALHMIVQNDVQDGENLLVFGCGVMGLCTIAGLKALHPQAKVLAVEPDRFHAEVAKDMGADEIIPPAGRDFYERIAELTGARMFRPLGTRPILVGGVDRVFDAVGTTRTVEASLRVLANGGEYNLLGIGAPRGLDWTPVWLKELTLRGIYGAQEEQIGGGRKHDFDLAMELYSAHNVDISHMVTHRFRLDQWQEALKTSSEKGKSRAIKVVFTPGE